MLFHITLRTGPIPTQYVILMAAMIKTCNPSQHTQFQALHAQVWYCKISMAIIAALARIDYKIPAQYKHMQVLLAWQIKLV